MGEFDITDKKAHGIGYHIENMRNRITAAVTSKTSGNMPTMQYTVSDDANIAKYGLLAKNCSVNSIM